MDNSINTFLAERLEGHVISRAANYHARRLPTEILFLNEHVRAHEDGVYIVEADELARMAQDPEQLTGTYLFVPKADGDVRLPPIANATLFVTNLGSGELYNTLHGALVRLGSTESGFQGAEAHSFSSILTDVLSRELTRDDEIRTRLAQLRNMTSGPFFVLVMEFEDSARFSSRYPQLRNALAGTFRHSNTTAYFNQVVTLVQMGDGIDEPYLPEGLRTKLEGVCQRFGCTCALSNLSDDFSMLRSDYLNASEVLSVGKLVRTDPNERVFDSERYYIYSILGSYYYEYQRLHHVPEFTQTLHPGVAALVRYDREHGTELRQLLCCYLLNERNFAQTATAFGMHRNTVVYKMRKAFQITGENFEDPMARLSLLISCLACEYYELSRHVKL